MMKTTGLVIALFAAASVTSRVAEAYPSNVSWSSAATGCVLASTTTADPLIFDSTYGEVDFASGDKGTYHLVCPVTALSYNEDPDALFVAYNDSDTSKCQISAVLRYHNLTTSTYGTVATVTATTGSGSRYLGNNGASVSLDLDDNVYWLDLTVTSTDSTVSFCSVNNVWLTTFIF